MFYPQITQINADYEFTAARLSSARRQRRLTARRNERPPVAGGSIL